MCGTGSTQIQYGGTVQEGKRQYLSLMLQGKALKLDPVLSNTSFHQELPPSPRHYSWRRDLLTMSKSFGIWPLMWSSVLAVLNM